MDKWHGPMGPYLLPLLLLLLPVALALESSFEAYPQEAQSCLYAAARGSQCSGDSVYELNSCLCTRGAPKSGGYGFVYGTALCLGPTVSASVVSDVYDQMEANCNPTRTPLLYTKSEFMAWAAEEALKASSSSFTTSTVVKTSIISSRITVTKTASSTSTLTSSSSTASKTTASTTLALSASPGASSTASATTPSSPGPAAVTGDDNKSTLSTGTTVGIAVGASVGGLAALAGLGFFFLRRWRRSAQESTAFTILNRKPSTDLDGGAFPAAAAAAKETKSSHYSASTFGASPPPPTPSHPMVAEMPATTQVPLPQEQQEQPNFLGAWTPPTPTPYRDSTNLDADGNNAQHGIAAAPRPQSRPLSGIFELDSGGTIGAVPRQQQGRQQYHQSGWQPIAQQPDSPRDYRPYMPQ